MNPEEISEKPDSELWTALTDSSELEKSWIYRELGGRAYKRRDYSEAATLADQAASIALEIDDHRLAADNFMRRAWANYQGGLIAETANSYNLALAQWKEAGDQEAMSDTLWRIADIHMELSDYPKVLEDAKQAFDFAFAEENSWLMGQAKYYEAKAQYYLDDEQDSLTSLEESRNHFHKNSSLTKVAMVDDFAATVQDFLGNYQEAVNLLRSCAHIAEATRDDSDDAYSLLRLGNALTQIGEYQEAIDYLERSKAAYRQRDDLRRVALIERDIADNLAYSNKPKDALTSFERAQSLLDSLGDDSQVRYCKMRRSYLLHQLGDFPGAERLTSQVYLEVKNEADPENAGYEYWVGLYEAGNLLELDKFEEVLTLTSELNETSGKPTPKNLVWKHTLRARALYYLDRNKEAHAEAEAALALLTDDIMDADTAYLYEIRAYVLINDGKKSGERDLAHAIAIHLAAGQVDEARTLAEYFIPKLKQEDDLGLGSTTSLSEETLAGDGLGNEPGQITFGFTPNP